MMISKVVLTFSIWEALQIKRIKEKIGTMGTVQKELVLKK
jgi:hypothetical protein